jgi:hypothetical protein
MLPLCALKSSVLVELEVIVRAYGSERDVRLYWWRVDLSEHGTEILLRAAFLDLASNHPNVRRPRLHAKRH